MYRQENIYGFLVLVSSNESMTLVVFSQIFLNFIGFKNSNAFIYGGG